MKESLNNLMSFRVRPSGGLRTHHKRGQQVTVRPEPAEWAKELFRTSLGDGSRRAQPCQLRTVDTPSLERGIGVGAGARRRTLDR